MEGNAGMAAQGPLKKRARGEGITKSLDIAVPR